MPVDDTIPRELALDDYVRAYEEAWERGEHVKLQRFLPGADHPLFRSVLLELVRTELEYCWTRREPRSLGDYQGLFPELFRDRESLDAITFEEYRLRRQAGEDATPAEYASRFGVDVSTWPSFNAVSINGAPARSAPSLKETASWSKFVQMMEEDMTREQRLEEPAGRDLSMDASAEHSADGGTSCAQIFENRLDAGLLAASKRAIPRAGTEFRGFRLLVELGRGSFSRVYLSRQRDLGDRLVVLKIVPDQFGETHLLAQLQHAHIVPIYSVHQADDFHAFCMPFFGETTLADIVNELRRGLPTLPDSGKYLLDRIEAKSRERTAKWEWSIATAAGTAESKFREPLGELTYVDTILRLAVRLADGLAHAHSRGIVHRDLKPANILLTDDGEPMLLDFNLSEDTKLARSPSAESVAGTLPYMAPEQLAAIENGTCAGDERSDLYSFAIILYELLTGRHPFAKLDGSPKQVLHDLFMDRHQVPDLRRWNAAISLGAESIVRHCLEPEPSRRYQTARDLRDDLQRELEDLPLKYAPEPSLRERARKWARRHPRMSSSTTVAVIAALLVLALAGAFALRVRQLARSRTEHEAERARFAAVGVLHRLHDDLKVIEALLGSDFPDAESEQRHDGIALGNEVLDRYSVLDSPSWQEAQLVWPLAPEQKTQVRENMGELLLLLAGAAARQAQLEVGLRLNGLAAGCYPTGAIPPALWRQRAELARSAGNTEEALTFERRADEAPSSAQRNQYFILLSEFRAKGRLPDALPLLKEASRAQSDNFSVWMILGNCYAELAKHAEAVECYDMASALWPESLWPYLCQGLANLDRRDFRKARGAFDNVIRLRPNLLQAYFNRAVASYQLGDLAAARADLTHVLADSKPPLRAYFLRAKILARLGDREGARRDQEAGLHGEPRDERDLTARGLARQPRDPKGALADYQSALKINPRYRAALQNKANVLAEDLDQTDLASETLDQLLSIYPNSVPARAGRGVLHARLGRREAAHADAQESLRQDSTPLNVYQAAGIYALTSRQNSGDRKEAFRLLGSALNQGFGLDLIDRDRDLDPIRNEPEFRAMVEAARARRAGATSQTTKAQRDPGKQIEAGKNAAANAVPQ